MAILSLYIYGMKKFRLDLLTVERGLFATRQAAQTAIMDGAVLVNGEKCTKPGMNIAEGAKIELIPGFSVPKYVSRGGLKLEKALDEFVIDVAGRVCVDVGASTGGFTDCLLKRGAERVYAVDVGYGQLDWSLRSNEKVIVFDRLNARYLQPESIYKSREEYATLAVSDVSFISLSKVLPAMVSVLQPERSEIVGLIKPQFEAGREQVGKGGVVKSAAAHVQAIATVSSAASALGLVQKHLTFSPVTGPAGNIEYLIHLANFGDAGEIDHQRVVDLAIETLRK
ncbi:MAG TPA: TlyA family RNA methyltransferase [Planktothrix sp.]|jgi:23S rRNA (cytidine1920-2'-O)/16S rRNA (cytidine1409-2'-O)-methyltransferase